MGGSSAFLEGKNFICSMLEALQRAVKEQVQEATAKWARLGI